MRLNKENVKDIKEALICDKDRRPLSYTCCIELIETIEGLYDDVDSLMKQLNRNIFAMNDAEAKIEALQQENEQLKADCDRMLGEVQELTMEYNHFKKRKSFKKCKGENKPQNAFNSENRASESSPK